MVIGKVITKVIRPSKGPDLRRKELSSLQSSINIIYNKNALSPKSVLFLALKVALLAL
jgi:hypothetical protein